MRKDDERMSDDKKPEPVARLLISKSDETHPRCGGTIARTYEELPENVYPDHWEEGEKLYTARPVSKKPEPVALKFPRHPNSEDVWTIDFNFLANVQNKIVPVDGYLCLDDIERVLLTAEKTYTAQPAREWVGLTDGELRAFKNEFVDPNGLSITQIFREIENLLKEKNT